MDSASIDYLRELASSGLMVIPTTNDKRPAVRWGDYYRGTQAYVFSDLEESFKGYDSVALLTGDCSGGVEIIDIDLKYDLSGTLHRDFSKAILSRVPDFFKLGVCVVKTPSGGYHFVYRLQGGVEQGNRKLASRPLTDEELKADPSGKSRVLIETRGKGGYALIDPSKGYEIISGNDYSELPVLTRHQRDLVIEAAVSFNEVLERKRDDVPRYSSNGNYNSFDIAPWDDFNNKVGCEDILIKHGYRVVGHSNNDLLVLRPGDSKAAHSGYVHTDSNIFVCFSSSTPFEQGKGYSAYMVYTVLEHKGDSSESTKALIKNGYGSRQQSAQSFKGRSYNDRFRNNGSNDNYTPDEDNSSNDNYIPDEDNSNNDNYSSETHESIKAQKKSLLGNYTLSDEVRSIVEHRTFDDETNQRRVGYSLEEDYLSTIIGFPEQAKAYIDSVRNGTFSMGKTTGSTLIDQYFRFKEGNLVAIHGIANVGKSIFTWYLCLLSAVLHGWRWVLYVAENDYEHCVRSLVQFYCGDWVDKISEKDYAKALAFINKHFTIIKNTSSYTASEICSLAEYLHFDSSYGPFNGLVIDPYNSLVAETAISEGLKKVRGSKHDLDYEVMSGFRSFCNRTKMTLFMNVHTGTEKARNVQQTGKAPNMYDVEGGGKFANRMDDFITTHRNTKDPERKMITEMHVDKIKATETGGRPTSADGPLEFYLWYAKYRFLILDESSPFALDPMELATGRGTGQYNKRAVMNPFENSAEKPPLMEIPSKEDLLPAEDFFTSSNSEDLPF